jgi:diadenosine tetraphosphate (Ap4A) HIT family hydrolase
MSDDPSEAGDDAAAPSVFSLIIRGDLPGRFVWRDDDVVAFMTIAPIRPGHVMVVPIEQVDHWIDVAPALWARMAEVQLAVGAAVHAAFRPARVATAVVGLEVPHCHVHLVPINAESELSFANADPSTPGEEIEAAAEAIRAELRAAGHGAHVPA